MFMNTMTIHMCRKHWNIPHKCEG